MQVEVAHSPASVTRAGQTYHFCSDRCADKFAADNEAEATVNTAASASALDQRAELPGAGGGPPGNDGGGGVVGSADGVMVTVTAPEAPAS